MSRLTIATILFLSAVFVFYPGFIHALEPFAIDDFEGGVGGWSSSQGAGAPSGAIEETKDAHDGKAGKITMPKGSGWMVVRSRDQNFAELGDGYEAFNFWTKAIEGADQWIRIMFYGIGDFSGKNRWTYDFKAPLEEWTLMSIPFEDIQPWRGEQRPFDPKNLAFMAFVQEANPPLGGEQTTWGDIEFIVDQIEFGLIASTDMLIQPSGKLPAMWGQIKQYK